MSDSAESVRKFRIRSLHKPAKRRFIPLRRIAAIKWEEAVQRSRARREGKNNPDIRHFTCSCGSVDCLGVPFYHD